VIHIGWDPVAFSIGGADVRWYGIFIGLCILVMVAWTWYFSKKAGVSGDLALGAGLVAIPSGIIVSKLLHVIDKFGYYVDNPGEILGRGGLTVFGAVLGGLLGAWLYCRFRKQPFGPLGDAAAPGIALGMVVGRFGCTLNGCCHGSPTTVPWSYIYTNPASAAKPLLDTPLHPTQGYEQLLNAVLFVVMFWLLRNRLRPAGSLFVLYLGLYAAGTAVIRVFRGDVENFAGPLQEAQLVSIIIVLVCGYLLITRSHWVARGETSMAVRAGEESSG